MTNPSPRDINSGRPFHKYALDYYRAGWFPIPLKPRDKPPYESGYTGAKNEFPEDELAQITEWLGRVPKDCNIGLWLRDGVIGIDVDDYDGKEGGKTLRRLERKWGRLPHTWISSARTDGMSGIRYFKVPKGLAWPGKAGPGIDIVSRGYRFAVIYPSHHPDTGGTYQLYPPGAVPNGVPEYGLDADVKRTAAGFNFRFTEPIRNEVPDADSLPELPEKWVEGLQLGDQTDRPMDIVSTIDELDVWCANHFPKGRRCTAMQKRLDYWKEQVRDDPSSHDKVTGAHWNLLSMAVEGHKGWKSTLAAFEKFWSQNAIKRGKRNPDEAAREIFRSRYNAIRQKKAEWEEAQAKGFNSISSRCACFRETDLPVEGSQVGPVPASGASDPSEYRLNDDGNAAHLVDLFPDELKWVPARKQWIFWNGERWISDDDGIAARCFWRVRDRQEAYAQQLAGQLDGIADEDELKAHKKLADRWRLWAEKSGNVPHVKNALTAASVIEGVSLDAETLDADPRLLGVKNGIVELTDTGAILRKAKHDDYVTMNTKVDYFAGGRADLLQAGGDLLKGVAMWDNYLNTFVPDPETQRFLQKIAGYALLGRNVERLCVFLYGGTSTGKSTFLESIMNTLGQYAQTVDLIIFKGKELNPALAQALPMRVITASEAGQQNHMHGDVFKRITGNEHLAAELKGVNKVERRVPAFLPMIATNQPPTIQSADKALYRRLVVIPFDQEVKNDDKMASEKLKQFSREAILAWMIDGWRMYAQEGLDRKDWPESVLSSTKSFGAELSDLGEFIADVLEETGDDKDIITVQDLYDAYRRWASGMCINEREIMKKTVFGRNIKSQGLESKPTKIEGKAVRSYRGYKLVDQSPTIKIKGGA